MRIFEHLYISIYTYECDDLFCAVEEANTYTNENAVLKENITTAATVPETVEAASDAKVISEKVFMDAMTWKTSM